MRDVTTACDLLRPVWERTEGGDGYVSIEVDPNLADDTEATIDASDALPRGDRAPEPAGQDPGHRRRRAGDRGDDRPRLRDQRDPDLLAHPPPPGRRGLPARTRAARRLRRRPESRPLGRQLLRLPRRHRDRPPPRRNRPRRPQGAPRHRQRQARLPAVQGSCSTASAGTSSPRAARPRSAASGRRRR